MTLKDLEARWSTYLAAETCPPVLGLAPLSEEESKTIYRLLAIELNYYSDSRMSKLLRLLEQFPACLTVWLARKAGEAYEAGAFWDKFGELIGIPISLNRRGEFSREFRLFCRIKMSTWLPARDLGAQHFVAEFLHQAGLPLDRCAGFAQHVRKVEGSLGLPDPEDPDAGEQLREAVLDSLQNTGVPSLKRALRGPAGSRICEVALSVILKSDFSGINPRLGQELARAFEDARPGTLRRSAHQPFLRLGNDLGSLEVIGPTQDPNLVGPSGVTWIVDGRHIPTPRAEEFSFKVTERPRVVLELAGLVSGTMPGRTFVLRLEDLPDPFIMFDERTRKQRRVQGSLPAGGYWLLHQAADTFLDAEQTYEWPDGQRALSFFRLRPGEKVRFESQSGRSWQFTAAFKPSFDPSSGKALAQEDYEPIYFGWLELPYIWLPEEEADEGFANWRVCLQDDDSSYVWTLSRTTEQSSGMVKCRTGYADFLTTISPGMHLLQFELRRGEHGRIEAKADYWFWQGLQEYNLNGFQLHQSPKNLVYCEGFVFEERSICHISDHHRRHTLVFKVAEAPRQFHWPQPGIFVESVERRIGKVAQHNPHRFGEAFSAGLDSMRWIRIWLAGQPGWEILVAGQSWHRDVGGDRRDFVELSLASLAAAFPQGGDIRLRQGESERLIAYFSSPLQPIRVERTKDESRAGLRFHFTETVNCKTLVVRDLASGIEPITHPDIHCESVDHSVAIETTKEDWPDGFWIIELQVRRDESAEWEPVILHGRDRAPLVFQVHNNAIDTNFRARLFWDALESDDILDLSLNESDCTELFQLLWELVDLQKQPVVQEVRQEMAPVNNALQSLTTLAGRIARQPAADLLQTKLLGLACQDPSHTVFVHLPGLLALPASEYRELPTGDPLNNALRQCGRIAASNSIADAVRKDQAFLDFDVLSCFANFHEIASLNDESSPIEFKRFNHDRYWSRIIGIMQADRLVPDWSGDRALGKMHAVWAMSELMKRFNNPSPGLKLGPANAVLHCANEFRRWLNARLETKQLMMPSAWREPWPRFEAPEVDLLEAAPRFASLLALAARAAAAGLLEFDEAMSWLESNVPRRWMADEGIAVLVCLAPELFGWQLLFWELIVRTAPH